MTQPNQRIKRYRNFIAGKILAVPSLGFDVDVKHLHPSNKPHQSDIITWAVKGGQRAIFASFGMGKTQIQLEIANAVCRHTNGRFLIVCPLGVKQEFKEDCKRLGIPFKYVRNNGEIARCENQIVITNYERIRDGQIDVNQFVGTSLDEASALRSSGSKTYLESLKLFKNIPFRFVATATPSPNDYIELLNYAAFLGIMDVSQAKTRFFKRDSEHADQLKLHPNKEREFWLWVSSWALFITDPADLGYDSEGYALPELKVNYHILPDINTELPTDMDGNIRMFKKPAKGLSEGAREKRNTVLQRFEKAKSIIDESPNDHFLLWHHLERERVIIEKLLPEVKTLYGNQPDELKEELIVGFSKGEFKRFAPKPEMAGQGCNFQRFCHRAIFMGINYKFNEFIQAIHRIYRFLQEHACTIDIICTEAEQAILDELLRKWKDHDTQMRIMKDIIRTYGLAHNSHDELKRKVGVQRDEVSNESFRAIFNDTVEESATIEDNSVGLIFTSTPFSTQYEYSANYNDFGHNESNDRFFEQLDYTVPDWHRILMPGRLLALHVKDRIVFGNFSGLGYPTLYPFSDDMVRCITKHGFGFMGRITIPTDVVRENKQTNRLGWTEVCKDGSKMGVGVPEYILLFRKSPSDTSNAYADLPVIKDKKDYTRARWQIDAHALWLTNGNRLLSPDEYGQIGRKNIGDAMELLKRELSSTVYDYDRHVAIAEAIEQTGKLPTSFMAVEPVSLHPDVWCDITRMRGLNTTQKRDEQHLCPLPFDITTRVIRRYSNAGEIVYDPFAGLFTVPYCAIQLGRIGWGCELNHKYWKAGVSYCRKAYASEQVVTLFDVEKEVA